MKDIISDLLNSSYLFIYLFIFYFNISELRD